MNTISGHTKLTALLGSPVSHSISPLMHNEAFRILGLDYIYLCFDVNEQELPKAVEGLRACKIRGFNLTMPNKNAITSLLDELSPAAKLIGAVNTVVNDDGRLIGYNTDGIGFMQSVRDAGISVKNKTITLMGAGGAGTAICAQAALDGASDIHLFVRKTSRFMGRTRQLADNINQTLPCRVHIHDNEDEKALKESLSESVLLINATSVGMAPATDMSIIQDTSLFSPSLAVADVIYNPRETRLLAEAKAAGCKTFNGMYMLLYQGAEAFRLWTGQDMPVEPIRQKYFS